jgi:hypothetical protein
MVDQEDKQPPKLFISYSHDSPAHKKWVGELASKLVENGVDVILDQWDLGLGDDVPKFMENGVTVADRVLMICTENYVRKANEGEGGVGYEAMIVTGELVQNLGTSKFIPAIRQTGKTYLLPKSVTTRRFVNFSEDQAFDEQFQSLLMELHQVPASRKPPLGRNPFEQTHSGIQIPTASKGEPIPDIRTATDISSVYQTALEVARRGDLVAWRRIVRQATVPIPSLLGEWRRKYEPSFPREIPQLQEMALEGSTLYSGLIAIALAGIESGKERFSNQVSLLDEILNPRDWNWAGFTTIADFPETVAFIYQGLHGAMCLQTHQLTLAIKFARSKIKERRSDKIALLYQRHALIGWPETLGGKTTNAWAFLMSLPEKWKWLLEPFGSETEFREAMCAYYLALNVLEFVDTIAENQGKILQEEDIRLDVPLCFLHEKPEVVRRGYQLLLSEPEQVKDIWKTRDVPEKEMVELWPLWIKHLNKWLNSVYEYWFLPDVIHKNLFDELG